MECNKNLTYVCECNIKLIPNISRITKNIFALVVYVKKRNSFLEIDDPIYQQFNEKFIQDSINKDLFNFHNLIWNKHAILLKDLDNPQYFIKESSNTMISVMTDVYLSGYRLDTKTL